MKKLLPCTNVNGYGYRIQDVKNGVASSLEVRDGRGEGRTNVEGNVVGGICIGKQSIGRRGTQHMRNERGSEPWT